MYNICYYKNDDDEINNILIKLMKNYPLYMQEPDRLRQIMVTFKVNGVITIFIEEEYVDRQYRDTYYSYFSQKYTDIPRNCIRLLFFEGEYDEMLMQSAKEIIQNSLIGAIVLRPLTIGNIGLTLLSPFKLKVEGYVQLAQFKLMIFGKKISISAFPFLSQDDDSMSCAETSLFNLMQYYGEKYSEYRVLMPSEILKILEKASYQRVLPSTGMDDSYMAKVLSESHFYPRLYSGVEDFDFLLHTYVESGIPFIVGLPLHAAICIGHGPVDHDIVKHKMDAIVESIEVRDVDENSYVRYFLDTAKLVDEYLFMDDNQIPYLLTSTKDITLKYYKYTDAYRRLGAYYSPTEGSEDPSKEAEVWKKCENQVVDESELFEEFQSTDFFDYSSDIEAVEIDKNGEVEVFFKEAALEKIKKRHNALLVPLYRRIFLDASRAKSIFDEIFLHELPFINAIQCAYDDERWGVDEDNPIVWRMYLASSNSYKEFRAASALKHNHHKMFEHYSENPFPRFIWVMELGTISTLKSGEARVEIVLDATSSPHTNTHSILSIGYKGHFVFVPYVEYGVIDFDKPAIKELLCKLTAKDIDHDERDSSYLLQKIADAPLTVICETLYTSKVEFPATFDIFRNHNLKEILCDG